MKKDEYIGILTSGGDASGMNAAIRAVTVPPFSTASKSKEFTEGTKA